MSDSPLHLVLLNFADPSKAGEHMDGHNQWIDAGFADGIFVLTGTMPGRGGTVLMRASTTAEVEDRVARDPFVAYGVVTPEVIEIIPSRLADGLTRVLAGRPQPSRSAASKRG